MNSARANLIIAGVSKCGSTSLFSYLSAHPDVCGSEVKETQYFMPLKFGRPLSPVSDYEKQFAACHNRRYRLDATPYYLFGGKKLALAIKEYCPDARIIFVFRNPVERAYSWFNHLRYHLMIPQTISFREYLDKAAQKIRHDENLWDNDTRAFHEGQYFKYLPEWYEVFGNENIRILFFEQLKNNSRMVINSLCNYLNIDGNLIPDEILKPENSGGQYRARWFRHLFLWARRNQTKLMMTNKRLNTFLKNLEQRFNKTNRSDKLTDSDKEWLQTVFAPGNAMLLEFLKSKRYADFPAWLGK